MPSIILINIPGLAIFHNRTESVGSLESVTAASWSFFWPHQIWKLEIISINFPIKISEIWKSPAKGIGKKYFLWKKLLPDISDDFFDQIVGKNMLAMFWHSHYWMNIHLEPVHETLENINILHEHNFRHILSPFPCLCKYKY